jgi:hypothetical protein
MWFYRMEAILSTWGILTSTFLAHTSSQVHQLQG